MSINLPQHFVSQFSTRVGLLLQQQGSKLMNAMMSGTHVGKQASPLDQLGAVEAQVVTSRFAPMTRIDAPVDRRWVFPTDIELPQMIDSFDKLKMLNDPSSLYAQNAVNGLGRKIDDLIIAAFFGTAQTGETGATATSFLAGNVVSVNTGGTASNLNVAKLRAGKKLLMSYEVDLDRDPIFCPITSNEHDSLLNEIQVISTDFNSKPVMMDGRVSSFLGINFIHCERLTTGTDDAAGTSRAVPLYAKSGMYLGRWQDVQVDVSRRNDISGVPWQVRASASIGATRLEEKKVVKIWCR